MMTKEQVNALKPGDVFWRVQDYTPVSRTVTKITPNYVVFTHPDGRKDRGAKSYFAIYAYSDEAKAKASAIDRMQVCIKNAHEDIADWTRKLAELGATP